MSQALTTACATSTLDIGPAPVALGLDEGELAQLLRRQARRLPEMDAAVVTPDGFLRARLAFPVSLEDLQGR